MELAIAAFPYRCSSSRFCAGSATAEILSASILSTFVSTRLTKKLATLATLLRSPPFWCSFSRPDRYASTTSSYRSTAKISVMLMLWPLEIWSWIAGSPSLVAGIFTMTLGRRQRSRRSSAIAIVPRVLFASVGATSMLTKPSLPFVLSYTGRNTSAAAWMSSTIIPQSMSDGLAFSRTSPTIASS